MKTKRNFVIFLEDIADSINKIEKFIAGLDFDDFRKDDKTISAVVRKLEIIGEATKNIPANIRKNYPNINWRAMAGMRDKLIHEYFGIDPEILWKVIREDLPALKPQLKKILEDILK